MTSLVYIPAADAEIYKWVDAGGQTHYSQTPPPDGVEAETVKISTKVDTDTADQRLQGQVKMTTEAREARSKQAEERQKAGEKQAKNEEECNQAKRRLASYSRPRVNTVAEDGTRKRATEEARQAELVKAREAIKELCQ